VSALTRLVAQFDASWPVAVFITIHIGKNRSLLPEILGRHTQIPIKPAQDQCAFGRGIYVAPPDRHLIIEPSTISLSPGPKENHARPAIDPMFRSAARHHGSRVIGVLLTGHLNDGMNGLYEIHARGGTTIVQDPADAEVPDIPLNALGRLTPDHVLPLSQIPSAIAEIVSRSGS
jgi:two-component system chemotaxis response regulator CheB